MTSATASPGEPSSTQASGRKDQASMTLGSPIPGPPQPDSVMMHGILGKIVQAAAPTTEADPVGVLVSLMAGTGVLIGPRPHVMIGNTRHPVLIWPLLIGRTGGGRKGEATATARVFLESADPDIHNVMVSGLSSGEGLIERIKDRDHGDGEDASKPGWAGTDDKRLLVIESEFAGVMIRANREGSTLSPVMREAWDGRGLGVLTKKGITASSSHVGVLGHITPQEFRTRMSARDLAGGTYNRLLPVLVERSKFLPMPEGVANDIVTALGRELGDAIGCARTIGRVTLDDEARHLWETELYKELTDTGLEDSAWSSFVQRAAPYTLRIATLYAVLDGVNQISPTHLLAAVALVRYSMDSARHLLGHASGDRRVDKIRRAIDTAPNQTMSRTQVSGELGRSASATELDAILELLTADGTYLSTERPTGGRPVVEYSRAPGLLSSSFGDPTGVTAEERDSDSHLDDDEGPSHDS